MIMVTHVVMYIAKAQVHTYTHACTHINTLTHTCIHMVYTFIHDISYYVANNCAKIGNALCIMYNEFC